jgi:IS5 family transposase
MEYGNGEENQARRISRTSWKRTYHGRNGSIYHPYYPREKVGRPPRGIERMLRMYLLQNWYTLSDLEYRTRYTTAIDAEIHESESSTMTVPDATTLLHFRHLLEEHK